MTQSIDLYNKRYATYFWILSFFLMSDDWNLRAQNLVNIASPNDCIFCKMFWKVKSLYLLSRKSIGTCSVFLCGMETIFGGVESRDPVFISQFGDWFLTSAVGSHPVGTVLSPFPKIINTKCSCAADEYSSHQGGAKEIQDKFLKIYYGLLW